MLDYEQIDRMAHIISDWMNDITVPTDVPVMAICYCMEALTKLLKEQPEIVRCKDCFYADDFDCPAPLSTGYLCQKEHGCHTGDWFCADGERRTDDV